MGAEMEDGAIESGEKDLSTRAGHKENINIYRVIIILQEKVI